MADADLPRLLADLPEPTYWPKLEARVPVQIQRVPPGYPATWIVKCDFVMCRFGGGFQSIAACFAWADARLKARFPTAKLATDCTPEALEAWFAALPAAPSHVDVMAEIYWWRNDQPLLPSATDRMEGNRHE